jgi:hypothetical protein
MSLHHSPKIVTNGLVLCLDAADPKCYRGGSTCRDLTNINGNGTMTNISLSSDKGFLMNNSNSTISFNKNFASITNSVTYSVLCELNYPGFNNIGMIMSSSNNFEGGIYILNYGVQTNPNAYFLESDILADDGLLVDAIANSEPFYSGARKFFITVTINGTVYKMYINNILIGTSSPHTGGNVNTHSQIYLGYNPLVTTFQSDAVIGSKIYKSMIYNRALTDAEILQNYNALKGRFNL